MNKNNVKKLCICSILAALFVALELVASTFGKIAFLDNYQIPISCFPLILASVMFGFGWGTLTAVVGSFLSQLAFGIGWGMLLWMAPTVIYSISISLLFMAFRKSEKTHVLALEFFISSLVLSFLNTIAMYINNLIYGIPYDLLNKFLKIIISLKIVGAVIFAIIFAIITPPLVKKFKKIVRL